MMFGRREKVVGAVVWLGIGVGVASAGEEPDAAALVRQVRARESWIERVSSLRLRSDEHSVRTPQGVEKRAKELKARLPDADVSQFRDLEPVKDSRIDLAFDGSRVRLRVTTLGEDDDLRVWDGARFVLANHYDYAPKRDGYLINRDPKQWLCWLLWTHFASFRAGPHRFWWDGEKDVETVSRLMGKPEEFVYGGLANFHGISCHVVNHQASWTSLFIGAADGKLRGSRSGALTNLKSRIYVPTRAKAKAMHRLIDPVFEYTLADEKEVAPGCWLPMTQTLTIFSTGEDGKPFRDLTHTVTITEATVNQPLPDDLFAVTFREGVWVNDQTHNPPLSYRHKAVIAPEEWAKIIAEGKARATRDRAYHQKQEALIGKPAAPFPADSRWLNSKPLELGDLAGKLVILDFWAEWCGPCRNDLPGLAALHKRHPQEIRVIGIHPTGSAEDAIRKVVKEFDMQYPICVDVPAADKNSAWGRLYEGYGVSRIPHAVLLDRKGTIAATGELNAILQKAKELAGRSL